MAVWPRRREEKRWCSDLRTCELTVHPRYPSKMVLVLRRPGAHLFFSSLCAITGAILTPTVLIISHPFLSVRPSFIFNPSVRRFEAFGMFNLIGIDALDRLNRARGLPRGRRDALASPLDITTEYSACKTPLPFARRFYRALHVPVCLFARAKRYDLGLCSVSPRDGTD